MNKPIKVLALHPDNGELQRAALYKDHFGMGHDAIRFLGDGLNSPYHSARNIAWEPYHV